MMNISKIVLIKWKKNLKKKFILSIHYKQYALPVLYSHTHVQLCNQMWT